ncbi:MAG: Lrp/AsnC family transcriptional regulator [Candidatus Aenigmarchaeota archaeon]|nr:Lrp/AsnC family transcriptional regulator [Candidatus Aenigmarchaeota archaeon]
MIIKKLGIDEKDARIITFFTENPHITQKEIAERLGITQPSVNTRVQNLIEKGIMKFQVGVDLSRSGLYLARVDFTAKNANDVIEKLRNCTFFVNGYIMSGKNNVSVFLVAENLKKIDEIVRDVIKKDPDNSDINVNLVVSSAINSPVKINFLHELELGDGKCPYSPEICKDCKKVLGK